MHLGVRESVALARGVLRSIRGKDVMPEVILCPSFTALSEVHKVLARSRIGLGAQNVGLERTGAYTGEISVAMLEDVGAGHVLVGHSERRSHFGETDEMIHQKMEIIASSKVTPILCVGEGAGVRDAGDAYQFVGTQLQTAFDHLDVPSNKQIFIAYEPIWSIGTGSSAEVGDVVEMHAFIREQVAVLTHRDPADIIVLYGGSVDEENAYHYLRESEVQGVLIGGASLRLHAFMGILEAGGDVVKAQDLN